MITFSKIGHFGRLGNQLFQFASTIGIARKNGYDVWFPIENITEGVVENFKDGKTLQVTFDVPKAFELPHNLLTSRQNLQVSYAVKERHFHFDRELFNIPDGCDLSGYFQSEKYFAHVEDELRQILTFKPHIQQKARDLFPKVDGETVSIHVRRGDYVNQQQFHPVCNPEYYLEAASLFSNNNSHFIVFSDDVEYCKNLFEEGENVHYIDNVDPYVDLALMSMCNHNIIANSSFSWWGAWLNKSSDKVVVAPKQWFGPAYSHHIVNDLFCENWKVI